jgi:hypothetical protein
MDLSWVLIFYVILLFIFIFVFSKYGIQPLSAIVISVIICWLILNLIIPPNDIDEDESISTYSLYFLIQFLSFLLVIIYTLICATNDFKSDYITIKIHSKHIINKKVDIL